MKIFKFKYNAHYSIKISPSFRILEWTLDYVQNKIKSNWKINVFPLEIYTKNHHNLKLHSL